MKRSSQIGLAAAGLVLVATIWGSGREEATEESLVYNSLADCRHVIFSGAGKQP